MSTLINGPGLIIFEGMIGCGKSTTSQWLARLMNEQGRPAKWCAELSRFHPYRGPKPKEIISDDAYLEDGVARWTDAATRMKQSEAVWILDCGPLQKLVMGALNRGRPPEDIEQALGRVYAALTTLTPLVVHFEPRNVVDHIVETNNKRGYRFREGIAKWLEKGSFAKTQGVQGVALYLQFWEQYLQTCAQILHARNFPVISLDSSSQSWAKNFSILQNHFTLSEPGPEIGVSDRFLGCYQIDDTGLEHQIFRQENSICISNLMEPLEKHSSLIGIDELTCIVRGHDVTLKADSDAENISVESTWSRIDGVVLRRV